MMKIQIRRIEQKRMNWLHHAQSKINIEEKLLVR